MAIKHLLGSAIVAIGLSVLLFTWVVTRPDAQPASPSVQIDADDIGGVVRGKNGPEAGVWVIAQTTELGTRFAKMVVTDDRGRYVIPDLPPATYEVWVRGYGLVDSPKVKSGRGQIVNLTAVSAPTAKEAAEYYPAIYWLSMLKIPDRSLFPGTGLSGTGMPEAYKTQEQWLNAVPLPAAATATSSAARRPARFRQLWGRSRSRSTRGNGGSCLDRRPRAWRSSSRS